MGTTSLQIIAWTYVLQRKAGEQRPPDQQVFDKTITDQELVQAIQRKFESLSRNVYGGSVIASPSYRYEFRFATDGVTTQVYAGSPNHIVWSVRTFGERATTEWVGDPASTSLYGRNLMTTLHLRSGMPLPDWWEAWESVPETDG